uniref:Uncharacterized protein n=1 Tax=Acrobeloides nanus TaxID=290746 RepID=A0A914E4C3_9BILA
MGACVTTSGTILRVITTCVIDLKWIFRYAIVLYYGFFNLYIFIALVTWLKNDHIYFKRINQILKNFQRHNRVVTPTPTQDNKLILKNVEGKIVITNHSTEIYFSNLKYCWANPNVNTKNLI